MLLARAEPQVRNLISPRGCHHDLRGAVHPPMISSPGLPPCTRPLRCRGGHFSGASVHRLPLAPATAGRQQRRRPRRRPQPRWRHGRGALITCSVAAPWACSRHLPDAPDILRLRPDGHERVHPPTRRPGALPSTAADQGNLRHQLHHHVTRHHVSRRSLSWRLFQFQVCSVNSYAHIWIHKFWIWPLCLPSPSKPVADLRTCLAGCGLSWLIYERPYLWTDVADLQTCLSVSVIIVYLVYEQPARVGSCCFSHHCLSIC
jgi:hypothetical protein